MPDTRTIGRTRFAFGRTRVKRRGLLHRVGQINIHWSWFLRHERGEWPFEIRFPYVIVEWACGARSNRPTFTDAHEILGFPPCPRCFR